MTVNSNDDELNELPDDIAALLADEAAWAPVPDELQESIVAAVLAEVEITAPETDTAKTDTAKTDTAETGGQSAPAEPAPIEPTSMATVIAMPSRWKAAALGAAAALLVVAGVFGMTRLAQSGPDLELALAGTTLAPSASATAEITETDEGTRIVIEVSELPPAAPGTYYQAWLRIDAETGVSAGTFHLRDGDGPIELWAGVSTDDYPLLTITLQQEAQTESSGQVVLKALIAAE